MLSAWEELGACDVIHRRSKRRVAGTSLPLLGADVLDMGLDPPEVAERIRHLDKGIQHAYIRPSTPRLNGKVERSHRIEDEEFYRLLAGEVIDDAKFFNTKLHELERFYSFSRPHGALGGQTPYERLRQLTRPSV